MNASGLLSKVMELAGGELARWSRVELLKRTDLAEESSGSAAGASE